MVSAAVLRGFSCYVVAIGALGEDPTAAIRRAKVPARTGAAITADEVALAVAAGRSGTGAATAARDVAILLLLFYTGIRACASRSFCASGLANSTSASDSCGTR